MSPRERYLRPSSWPIGGRGRRAMTATIPLALLGLMLAAVSAQEAAAPAAVADACWSALPNPSASRGQGRVMVLPVGVSGLVVAAGVNSVVLTLDLHANTESWLTPQGLTYEDHLEFETRITGTVQLSPGRAEGDQWVSTEGQEKDLWI